jgi:hypothetical protein
MEQLSKSKLPCGHLSCYGFTDDGGKTGYCALCELARERERVSDLENVVRAFLAVTQLSDGKITVKIRQRADALLAPKPVAPDQPTKEEK